MKWFLVAWRRCTSFQGRAHRTEFWMFVLVSALILLGLLVIAGLMTGNQPGATPHPVGWLAVSFFVASLLPLTTVAARRLHDVGVSGWFQLFGLIPYLGWGIVIPLAWPGQRGANRFGEAPASLRDELTEAEDLDPLAAERARLLKRFGLRPEPPILAPEPPAVPLAFNEIEFLSRQPWLTIAVFAALAVVLVTGIGSWVAQHYGFNFVWLTPVSGVIYGGAGFAVARASGSPALAGATVALIDVGIVFLVSGIGTVPELPRRDLATFLSSLVIAGILGVLASMAGGWIAVRLRPRELSAQQLGR